MGSSPFAALADIGLSKITGQRTVMGLAIKEKLQGLIDGLNEAVKNYRLKLPTDSKFIEEPGKALSLKENFAGQSRTVKGAKRHGFNDKGIGKIANALDNLITFILDLGDAPFMMAQYNSVLSQ